MATSLLIVSTGIQTDIIQILSADWASVLVFGIGPVIRSHRQVVEERTKK